ncbi:MAG TPA: GAF domain-containing protein [Thermoanaerobaculia bacterium]|jgi:GAF domain-containing protein|nr:GAF domain-containing protein [Thermoanaerobaculia bacterium]
MKPEAGRVAEQIRKAGDYRWVGIYEVGPEEISVVGWSGPEAPAHPRFPKEQGLCGAAAASGKTVVVEDVTKDPRYLTTLGSTRSEIVVPVKRAGGEVVGLIDVESEHVDAFTPLDVRLLEASAGPVARLLR